MIIVPEPTGTRFQKDEQKFVQDNRDISMMSLPGTTTFSNVLVDDMHHHQLKHKPSRVVQVSDPCARKDTKHNHNLHKRNVVFDLDVIPEYSNPVAEITDEEMRNMWYGIETRRQARATVVALKAQLSTTTSKDEDQTTCSYIEHFQEALTVSQSPDGKLDSILRKMSMDTPVRGLEHCMFPEIAHSRRRVIHKILRAQARLPPHASPGQRAFLLREVSMNLTRPSRRIAQLLAIGDAKVVLDEMLATRSAFDDPSTQLPNIFSIEVR